MAPLFPAIFIGGPPHSGKSTLLYRLTQALRAADVAHYALRASPDGEGDWSNEAPPDTVRLLRRKQPWSPAFADQVSRAIDRRHLPLLVDAGGKVSPESAQIAAACTHGLLLAANLADLAPWRELLARHGRPLLAELRSELTGPQTVTDGAPVLRGVLSGLGHGLSSEGVCFAALLTRLTPFLTYSPDKLYHTHRALTNLEMILHLERAIHPLPAHTPPERWQPAELPVLLANLPADTPLALYGRAPNWLYAALAAFSPPAPQLFNPTLGWVTPPPLRLTAAPGPAGLHWVAVTPLPAAIRVELAVAGGYLDYDDAVGLAAPALPPGQGVALAGKLPHWLYAALVCAYRDAGATWVAVYQPQLAGAVVVWSQPDAMIVGDLVMRAAP